jgi:hypothetical protein
VRCVGPAVARPVPLAAATEKALTILGGGGSGGEGGGQTRHEGGAAMQVRHDLSPDAPVDTPTPSLEMSVATSEA